MAPALALALALASAAGAGGATAAPSEEPEMVRPDGPLPPTTPPPLVAVTPPDLVPPVVPASVWQAQRRKLRIQAGLSWTFAALGLVGMAVPLAILGTCEPETVRGSYSRDCPERRGALIAAPIFGALTLAALVPAVIFTDRLVYQRIPERAPQLGAAPGGLVLRF